MMMVMMIIIIIIISISISIISIISSMCLLGLIYTMFFVYIESTDSALHPETWLVATKKILQHGSTARRDWKRSGEIWARKLAWETPGGSNICSGWVVAVGCWYSWYCYESFPNVWRVIQVVIFSWLVKILGDKKLQERFQVWNRLELIFVQSGLHKVGDLLLGGTCWVLLQTYTRLIIPTTYCHRVVSRTFMISMGCLKRDPTYVFPFICSKKPELRSFRCCCFEETQLQ